MLHPTKYCHLTIWSLKVYFIFHVYDKRRGEYVIKCILGYTLFVTMVSKSKLGIPISCWTISFDWWGSKSKLDHLLSSFLGDHLIWCRPFSWPKQETAINESKCFSESWCFGNDCTLAFSVFLESNESRNGNDQFSNEVCFGARGCSFFNWPKNTPESDRC